MDMKTWSEYALIIRSYEATYDLVGNDVDKKHWFLQGDWRLISRTEVYHTSLFNALSDLMTLAKDAERYGMPHDMMPSDRPEEGDVEFRFIKKFGDKFMMSSVYLIRCEEVLKE